MPGWCLNVLNTFLSFSWKFWCCCCTCALLPDCCERLPWYLNCAFMVHACTFRPVGIYMALVTGRSLEIQHYYIMKKLDNLFLWHGNRRNGSRDASFWRCWAYFLKRLAPYVAHDVCVSPCLSHHAIFFLLDNNVSFVWNISSIWWMKGIFYSYVVRLM